MPQRRAFGDYLQCLFMNMFVPIVSTITKRCNHYQMRHSPSVLPVINPPCKSVYQPQVFVLKAVAGMKPTSRPTINVIWLMEGKRAVHQPIKIANLARKAAHLAVTRRLRPGKLEMDHLPLRLQLAADRPRQDQVAAHHRPLLNALRRIHGLCQCERQMSRWRSGGTNPVILPGSSCL